MTTGIGHVAFRITDLAEALDFYCGKLALREAFRLDREGGPSPWIVYLQVSPGNFIELFPGASGEAATGGVGYTHFCLVVDDLAATLRDLTRRGLDIEGEPSMGLDGNWQFWLTDPDGNRIELMQIMPGSPHAQADTEMQSEAGAPA
ncbi:MAG TPA: VOC family protein [Chloroflexota bacterium]|nr:VOC family protein [Chloroflexota bacterium]